MGPANTIKLTDALLGSVQRHGVLILECSSEQPWTS